MRRPVSVKTFLSSFLFFPFSASFISSFSQLFPLSQAASVATLPAGPGTAVERGPAIFYRKFVADGIRRKLGTQVLLALALGIVVGVAVPKFATQLKLLGDMFLTLIKAGVAPLVFLTIVHGIASAGDVKSVGRVGWRSIHYFEIVSTIALMLGLLVGNLMPIGQGMATTASGAVPPSVAKAAPQGFLEFMQHIVPDNFVGAFAKGELLQVVVLAVMVGIGILAIPDARREKINDGLSYVSEVLFSFINLVMKLAPIGAFSAVAYSVGSSGSAVLIALAQLVLSFYALVVGFVAVVLGLIANLVGFSLWRFLCYIKDEIFIVLGTASSESALPRLLIKLERLGCTKQTVGLVLPTGYAFNLDGTSLFMSMGVIFIAHAYGVPLTLNQQGLGRVLRRGHRVEQVRCQPQKGPTS
jgi:aerobic C4-dicarboxylate transport protein